jgi:hypothetical protein
MAKKSGGMSHRQSVRNKQHKGYSVCYVNLFHGDMCRLQHGTVVHNRFQAQAVLFAANSGCRKHERENGNYCCLGFHATPQCRPS